MKKIFSILLAGFIGFLGIFTTTTTFKNTAEPQYFLQNERKNAAVEKSNNVIDFYFDNSVNNYDLSNEYLLLNLNENSILSYYDLNNNLVSTTYLRKFFDLGLSTLNLSFYTQLNLETNYSNSFYIGESSDIIPIIEKYDYDGSIDSNTFYKNIWYFINIDFTNNKSTMVQIKGFRIENFTYVEDLEDINQLLDPYIGTLTSLESNTNQKTSIEQIGNIISDTTDWFVNIFLGLSDIFYSNGTLGVWGSVLFLGVAFTLITMCLKWVISLVRGI